MCTERTRLGTHLCEAFEYAERTNGTLSVFIISDFGLYFGPFLGLKDFWPCWVVCFFCDGPLDLDPFWTWYIFSAIGLIVFGPWWVRPNKAWIK